MTDSLVRRVEVSAPDDTVTSHASESGRWLKLMADIEHEPALPVFESKPVYGIGAPGFPFLPRPGSLES